MRHLWGVFGPPPFAHDRFSPNCHFSSQEKRWGQNKPLRKSRETPLRNLKSVGDKINPLLEIREIGFPFMTGELLVCIFVTSPRFHKAASFTSACKVFTSQRESPEVSRVCNSATVYVNSTIQTLRPLFCSSNLDFHGPRTFRWQCLGVGSSKT